MSLPAIFLPCQLSNLSLSPRLIPLFAHSPLSNDKHQSQFFEQQEHFFHIPSIHHFLQPSRKSRRTLLELMGLQQSKDELLHQQVSYCNIEGIKALVREGASLEWVDRDGKTPLMTACMNHELYNVAKILIDLGANVDSYRPGPHGGTPLHHAAKRGLEHTVKLLLSNGANALAMNDDCHTPLDVARAKGFIIVVRTMESYICLFSGWMREFYGPGFLEVLAPQLVSRKVWAVIVPCGLAKPYKLELVINNSQQDAKPRLILALWKANMEDPKYHQADPAVILTHTSTKTRFKFGPAKEGDKDQLQWFCNACKGIPQVMPPAFSHSHHTTVVPGSAPAASENQELARAINAAAQSATDTLPLISTNSMSEASVFANDSLPATTLSAPSNAANNDDREHEALPSSKLTGHTEVSHDTSVQASPSAPPLANDSVDDGPIQYPSIDSSPIDLSVPLVEKYEEPSEQKDESGSSSSCVICLDAPVEGACIPCGHMAGCMSCLKEIKAKKWGCPVCRADLDQVIRLYAV